MKTKVPFDEDYVNFLGKAVYLFSYYEWVVICIVERLKPGFVAEYSRKKSMTSRKVHNRFKIALEQDIGGHHMDKTTLESCSHEFDGLVDKRNALIHAHPSNDIDGAQILNYQSNLSKPISDMKWQTVDIEKFVEEVDAAAVRANELLHQFRP